MSRKTYSLSAAAIIGVAGLSFSSADMSGAIAQESDADLVSVPEPQADEIEFVAQEVVQAIPEVGEEVVEEIATPQASSLRQLVGLVDTDIPLTEQMRCLAGAVYFESRGEPLDGQLAVAKVVINRADDRRFPASYCGVVYQRAQFSFVKNGSMPRIRTGSKAWDRAKAIARIAHDGMWDSDAQDSLYFHAKYVRPSWSRKKQRRTSINTHIFYR